MGGDECPRDGSSPGLLPETEKQTSQRAQAFGALGSPMLKLAEKFQ